MECKGICSNYRSECVIRSCIEFKPKVKHMEIKVNKKCIACGCEEFVEDKICEFCGKEFKPMENKVILTEDQARDYIKTLHPELSRSEIEALVILSKQSGYIHKSPVEEAEEMYKLAKPTLCFVDHINRELIEKQREAIQEQKKEIERLKK